jgi:putative two-component system response regulator
MRNIQGHLKTEDAIDALELIIGTVNPLTVDHQVRVTELAGAIADELGVPEEMRDDIRVAAVLHDIGELSVPTDILNKPGPLLPEEYDLVKTHPRSGYEYLRRAGMKSPKTAECFTIHPWRRPASC